MLCAAEEREAAEQEVVQLFGGRALEVLGWRPGTEVSPGEADTVVTYLGDGAVAGGEARDGLVRKPLPWLRRAGEEDFKELNSALHANALPSTSYLTLMVLSTLLAALGLFANSAPVIIGAMILAPLMAPIVSLAMAVVRQDARLLVQCLRSLGLGLFLAVGFAMLVTLVTPLQSINSEIAARLKPTLLDLGVAVISGVAGAYAHAREEIARSLAGVAIAVGLVPPLAVAGIGLGRGSWTVFSGASLLSLTNLAGIVLAASLTFRVHPLAPFERPNRRTQR